MKTRTFSRHSLIGLVMLGAIAAAPATLAEPKQLSGAEISALLPGKEMTGQNKSARAYAITYAESTMKGDIENTWFDEGKWSVRNDMYCRQWTEWGKGEEKCLVIRHVSGTEYQIYDPSEDRTVKVTIQ